MCTCAVDRSRDHVQPVRVDLTAAAQTRRHRRDQLAVHRHVRRPLTIRADHAAAADHQVVVAHDSTVTRPPPASARSHASATSSVPAAASTVARDQAGIARPHRIQEPLQAALDRRRAAAQRHLGAAADAGGARSRDRARPAQPTRQTPGRACSGTAGRAASRPPARCRARPSGNRGSSTITSSMSDPTGRWSPARSTCEPAACTQSTSPAIARCRSMWWLARSSTWPPPCACCTNQGRPAVAPTL